MELLSVRKYMDEYKDEEYENGKNFADLFEIDYKIRRINIVSAYFDIPSIEHFENIFKTKGYKSGSLEFVIIVDSSASGFRGNQQLRKNLLLLNNRIRESFPSIRSGIYLAKVGALFHSKAYLIEGDKNGECIVGSLNLTQNAIKSNEEIALCEGYLISKRNSVGRQVSDYITDLLKAGTVTRVDKIVFTSDYTFNGLRAMFMDGRIYYETKEQSPFRFKLNLPDDVLKGVSKIHSLLDSKISDTVSISELIANKKAGLGIELPRYNNSKSQWKKYCVQTCYGYWSPSFYKDELDDEIKERSKKYDPYYIALKNAVFERQGELLIKLGNLCKQIASYLEEIKFDGEWQYNNVENLKADWDKWIIRLKKKLENEAYWFRLTSGICDVSMPDVWSDPYTTDDFEESYFESVVYLLAKTTNLTKNWPAYATQVNIKIKSDDDWVVVRTAVISYLKMEKSNNIFEWGQ